MIVRKGASPDGPNARIRARAAASDLPARRLGTGIGSDRVLAARPAAPAGGVWPALAASLGAPRRSSCSGAPPERIHRLAGRAPDGALPVRAAAGRSRRYRAARARVGGFTVPNIATMMARGVSMTTVTLEFLAAQMDRLLGAVAALEAKWARLEMRLDEVATRFGTVGTSLESLEGRLAAVETRIGEVETRLEKLEGRSDETSTRLEELAGRLAAVETGIGALETRIGAVETRIGAVEAGIGALETRIGAVETRLERLEEEQRSLRASHEALDQRVREMTADGKLTLAFLARQAERIFDEQGRLRDDVTVLTGMVMRLEGTVQGLTVEVRGAPSRYERRAREVARLREPAPG